MAHARKQLQISVRAILISKVHVKFNDTRENNWKPLFALVLVRIEVKQIDCSLSISMKWYLIPPKQRNYHLIEILST